MSFGGEAFLKLLFVITWLNVFVILEPFLNRDGYRSMIFARKSGWRGRVGFFLALNGAFALWALVLTARI